MSSAPASKRPINRIVIHCSATPNGVSLFRNGHTPVQEIDAWHAGRGFYRLQADRQRLNPDLMSIGYHYVIYLSGAVVTGRHPDEIGAHVEHYNKASLGICLIGTDAFTPAQWSSLAHLVAKLRELHEGAAVLGHRDFPEVRKTCPGFDVSAWLAAGMVSDIDHTLQEGEWTR